MTAGVSLVYEIFVREALLFSLEEDFMKWRESFWPAVCNMFGLQASGEDINARNYRLELVEPSVLRPDQVQSLVYAHSSTFNMQIFTGEMARLNSYRKQRAPFDAKNPFLAKVVTNRELHTDKSTRSCRHIEFDIGGSRLRCIVVLLAATSKSTQL